MSDFPYEHVAGTARTPSRHNSYQALDSAAFFSRANALAGSLMSSRRTTRRMNRPLQPGGKLKFQLNVARQLSLPWGDTTTIS